MTEGRHVEALFCQACRARSEIRICPPQEPFTSAERRRHNGAHGGQMVMHAALTVAGPITETELNVVREKTFARWVAEIPMAPKGWRKKHPCAS